MANRWSPTVVQEAPRVPERHPLADAIRFGLDIRARRKEESQRQQQLDRQAEELELRRAAEARTQEYQMVQIEQMRRTAERQADTEERQVREVARKELNDLRVRGYRLEGEPTPATQISAGPLAIGTDVTPAKGAPRAKARDPRAEALAQRYKEVDEAIDKMYPGSTGMTIEMDKDGRRWVKNLKEEARRKMYADALNAQNELDRAKASQDATFSRTMAAISYRDKLRDENVAAGPAGENMLFGPKAHKAELAAAEGNYVTRSQRIDQLQRELRSDYITADREAEVQRELNELLKEGADTKAWQDRNRLRSQDPRNYIAKEAEEWFVEQEGQELAKLFENVGNPSTWKPSEREDLMKRQREARAQRRKAFAEYLKKYGRLPGSFRDIDPR